MSDPEILLVTRGDDAGLTPGVNAAIHDAVTDGVLRNVSMMAPAPAVEDAVDRLGSLENVDTGLHLTLTAEFDHPRWGPIRPAEEVPSLVDANGHFPRTVEALAAQADLDEVVSEVRAQLRSLRAAGFDVDYLDTHMMASRIGGLSDALQEICDGEGLIFADRAVPAFTVEEGAGPPPDQLQSKLQKFGPETYALVGHPCYDGADVREIVVPDTSKDAVTFSERLFQTRLFVDSRIPEVCDRLNAEPCRYTDVE